jgi:hypothetical protein
MSVYKLNVFEPFGKNDYLRKYRFAVIDPNNFKGYPANFVCVLPRRIFESGKPVSAFGRLFGDKSSEFAIKLLKAASIQEKDEKVKSELEKRLKLLESQRPKLTCNCCNQEFQEYSRTKYKARLCKSCLELRMRQNRN